MLAKNLKIELSEIKQENEDIMKEFEQEEKKILEL